MKIRRSEEDFVALEKEVKRLKEENMRLSDMVLIVRR